MNGLLSKEAHHLSRPREHRVMVVWVVWHFKEVTLTWLLVLILCSRIACYIRVQLLHCTVQQTC